MLDVRRLLVVILVVILPACAALLVSAPAFGYVRTRSVDTNAPFFWWNPQVTIEVARPSASFSLGADAVRGAALAAVDAWSYPTLACTSVALTLAPGVTDTDVVAFDGHNRIVVRSDAWCRDPDGMTHCHDPSQVALTTVFSRSKPGTFEDGEILEADIEVNDVGYDWAVIPDGPLSGRDYADVYDLSSALTHELGHFLGLAHDCLLPGEAARVDDQGNLSPACGAVSGNDPQQVFDATMYALMRPSDVSWRSLTSDDARAVCTLYPRAGVTVSGGCTVSAEEDDNFPPSLAAIALLAAIAAVETKQRRPRSR